EVTLAHFVLDVDAYDFAGGFGHRRFFLCFSNAKVPHGWCRAEVRKRTLKCTTTGFREGQKTPAVMRIYVVFAGSPEDVCRRRGNTHWRAVVKLIRPPGSDPAATAIAGQRCTKDE